MWHRAEFSMHSFITSYKIKNNEARGLGDAQRKTMGTVFTRPTSPTVEAELDDNLLSVARRSHDPAMLRSSLLDHEEEFF